jgi:hypothetical protein
MSVYGSGDVAFVLMGGYSIMGDTTDVEFGTELLTEETTTLGDTWTEHGGTGLRQATFTHNGFYNDAALASNAALVTLSGTPVVSAIGLAGNTIGRLFTGFAGLLQGGYTRQASRGALHKANGAFMVTGAVEEGKILRTHSTTTAASGNTEATSVDNAASSANGGAGYLEVSALTLGGYTNVAFKVRHSADNITFADLVTFTAVTAAPNGQRIAVAGTVNRYLASSYAFTGAGTGQSVTAFVGFARS